MAVFLLVPFALRHLSNALEPYPAVLLPVGSGTLDLAAGSTTVVRYGLLAHRADGSSVEVDPKDLLGRAAGAHWPRLAATAFNTRPTPRMPMRGRALPPWPAATPSQQEELRDWLVGRAKSIGLGAVEGLVILRHERRIDLVTGIETHHATHATDTLELGR